MDTSDDFELKKEAFVTVLQLFELDVLRETDDEDDLAEYGAFVLCNLTTLGSTPATLQNWVRENTKCFEMLIKNYLSQREENGDRDIVSMISNVLYNLCFRNETNQAILLHDQFLRALAEDCLQDDFDRTECAKLLLLLYEDHKRECETCIGKEKSVEIFESLRAAKLSSVITAKCIVMITGDSQKALNIK
jgi:hypothetical protein